MEPYKMPDMEQINAAVRALGGSSINATRAFADFNRTIRESHGYLEMQRRLAALEQEKESERWRNDPLELKTKLLRIGEPIAGFLRFISDIIDP